MILAAPFLVPPKTSPDEIVRTGIVAPHLFADRQSKGAFRVWPHIRLIGETIAREIRKGDARILINLPPGSGKSELISYWTPAWFLANFPSKRVILGTNTTPLAEDFGGRVKNTFEEAPALGVTVADDTNAKGAWKTTAGGGMKSVGVGKAVIGFRCHLFVIDDPYATWADAQSGTTRKEVADWYRGTASNRLEPGGSVIVLHHRMHPADLSHHLLSGEDSHRWKHICLPSLALDGDPLGRAEGDALCAERSSRAKLLAIRSEMQGMWEPMHQQNPMSMTLGGAYSRFGPHNVDPAAAFRPDLPLQLAIDFNINPGMHVILGQYDPIFDQAWAFDEIHGPRMSVEGACAELGRRLGSWAEQPSRIEIYGDPAGASKWAGTGQSQYDILAKGLQPLGIELAFLSANAHPPVIDRVSTMNYTLRDIDGVVRYRVHPRCDRLIRDYTQVQLDAKGGIDKTDQQLTHASDGEGYRIHELRGIGAIKQPDAPFVFG